MRTPLDDGWTIEAIGGEVPADLAGRRLPATVPGCATTDLMAAGAIPDPYLDENEHRLAWIGRSDWRFATRFEVEPPAPGERLDLVCEGLDTIATLELNGVPLGRTANMHRSYRFDLRGLVRSGENELHVEFAAPVTSAERLSAAIGPRPHTGVHPFNAIRKMACGYGWDWGPDLATAGIWRPIGLERWSGARIASVRPLVEVALPPEGACGRPVPGKVTVHVAVERAGEDSSVVEVRAHLGYVSGATVTAPGDSEAVVDLDVPEVELWWPAGYGEQPLYELEVSVGAGGTPDRPSDSWRGRVGFRRVDLDTSADAVGRRFTLLVNGTPIAVRGANWIPDDCFPHRVGAARYARRLDDARQANMNLLRVWGGGIYESEDFYAAADERGLLVWQDFLFACAAYAEEEPLRGEVLAEATEAVTRLSAHPSLVLWNGCNENLWGHEDWGWKEPLGERSWGLGYYLEILPEIVGRLDPSRPYSAGSPWSFSTDLHPNDPSNGTMHVWDVWNERDYTAYRDYAPRFVSEFGFQGPPAWSTLQRAIRERPLRLDSPAMLAHEKAGDGMGKLERGLAPHFPVPTSVEDWHWTTSLNQARAVTLGIEHWRSLSPRCTGTIVWQLNDCWPVLSWAAVDGDGRRKPLWYALRKCYRDRILTIQPRRSGLVVAAVNDAAEPWRVALEVVRRHFDGEELARGAFELEAAPGESTVLVLPPSLAKPRKAREEVLVASAGSERALWFFAEDKDLALPPPRLEARAEPTASGCRVHLAARTLQREVALLADKVAADAEPDDMLLTFLPGESATIEVRAAGPLDPASLLGPSVLRSANQLLHV